jgi:type IV pilus assembly protein PilB
MAVARTGEMLLHEGMITEEQLDRALKEQETTRERIGSALIRLGFVTADGLTQFLSRHHGVPAVDLKEYQIEPEVVSMVPASLVQKHGVLPLSRFGRVLTVAMVNPSDILAIEDIKFSTGYEISPVVAPLDQVMRLMDQHYGTSLLLDDVMEAVEETKGEDLEIVGDEAKKEDSEDISELSADSAPVVRLVSHVLVEAINRRASDIHIEPYEKELRIRYRVDGILHEILTPPYRMRAAIASRIKIMAKLKIEEKRIPQDGRIKVKVEDRVVDLRVSTVPTPFGEKIAIRILDRAAVTFELEALGLEGKGADDFLRAIRNPYGIVLVTGPTGCGKTTTLYAALSRINVPETNILTAEDPVEYSLVGINQLQVREDIGLSFGTALRSFLRQDPNIIMVGEIRDRETADIAIRASLTGHLVLSTVHTNSAALTIARLLDMGLEPFLLASSLTLVEAQRLVRRICSRCAEPVKDVHQRLPELGIDPAELPGVTLFRGKGCAECGNTGFRGRIGLYEVLSVTPTIREMVLARSSAATIEEQAVKEGMMTLRHDGIRKVTGGVTTIEEVLRETTA